MAMKIIDLDTVQANGKRGETQRPAFTKINANFAEVYDGLGQAVSTLAGLTGRMGGRNVLINGDFRFWQRGASKTVTAPLAIYVPDRYQIVCIGAGQIKASQQAFATPAFGATHYMNCDVSGATAATEAFCTQPVEGVQTLSGSTVTLSMQAWAASPGRKIGVRFIQSFGKGGSPDVTIYAGVQEIGTASSLRQFTADLPSIQGKVVGPDSKLHVIVDFSAPAAYSAQLVGQSGSFSLTCMQLERGAVPTEYEVRPDTIELMLCQRYFEKSYPVAITPGTVTRQGRSCVAQSIAANALNFFYQQYRVPKRTSAAVTLYSSESGAAGKICQNNNADINGVVEDASQSGFSLYGSNNSGAWGMWWHWTSDAEI
ncbi:hypothetical protein STENOSP10_11970 [Stenotrophomonas sepilia]|jgi:hypothetical protein|uniref:Uncharacterized protein n=2 Tax=Stenotrophomonas sepilia TaxID=2860290 RepID=A0ABQ6QB65_9GAMM|nr:hypothetical protein STENOSP10_11970 [Stenotrophomonas sepilia]